MLIALVVCVNCPMRYVFVLRVLMSDSESLDVWGWLSKSAAMMQVPLAAVQVARVIRLACDWAPKAWRALHSSAAASVLVLTGVDGMFFPSIEKYRCQESPNRLTRYEIVLLVITRMFSCNLTTVKRVLRLL